LPAAPEFGTPQAWLPKIAPRFDAQGGSRREAAFGARWLGYVRFAIRLRQRRLPVALRSHRPPAFFWLTVSCLCSSSLVWFDNRMLEHGSPATRAWPEQGMLSTLYPRHLQPRHSLTSTPQELIMNARRHTVLYAINLLNKNAA
jgi:hypothetical protein